MTIKSLSDTDFLYSVLRDGEWHELNEILDESKTARGHGLTVHSRAADLRAGGYQVDTMQRRNRAGRTDSFYKLVVLDEADRAAEEGPPAAALAGGSASSSTRQRTLFDQPFACSVDESGGVA